MSCSQGKSPHDQPSVAANPAGWCSDARGAPSRGGEVSVIKAVVGVSVTVGVGESVGVRDGVGVTVSVGDGVAVGEGVNVSVGVGLYTGAPAPIWLGTTVALNVCGWLVQAARTTTMKNRNRTIKGLHKYAGQNIIALYRL